MDTLAQWHAIIKQRDPEALNDILAEDCVFLSPVVHTPQRGRDITRIYLTGAMHVLHDEFEYVKEVADERHAVLEFQCRIDGIEVNGVDIMTFNEAGLISEFKVMVRPLKAINMVHAKMGEMLAALRDGGEAGA